jgi:hypothetical protein
MLSEHPGQMTLPVGLNQADFHILNDFGEDIGNYSARRVFWGVFRYFSLRINEK